MGYTHYWEFIPAKKGDTAGVEKLYQLAIRQCTRIARAYQRKYQPKDPNRLSGYTANVPLGRYGGVNINGSGSNGHESFYLREHYKQNLEDFGKGFHFCKTARKPYDVVVVACLIILKHYLKDYIRVSSDGNIYEWSHGLYLAQQVTKIKSLTIPIKEKKDIYEQAM